MKKRYIFLGVIAILSLVLLGSLWSCSLFGKIWLTLIILAANVYAWVKIKEGEVDASR